MIPAGEPLTLPAWRLRELVAARELGVAELVGACLERIAAVDGELRAFLHVDHEGALARAAELDSALARAAVTADALPPLYGIPVSVKDTFDVAGMPATAGSLVFRDRVPRADALAAARLRSAGAVIVGKTNTPEFAVWIHTVNRLQPDTRNPWDLERSPGGSSGGAAASVAAALTPVALASDGGGSTRMPAALCGMVGMQPSRGLVPRQGGTGGTLLFSSVGPIAADVRDAATVLQVLAGPFEGDPLAWRDPSPDLLSGLEDGVQGVRVRYLEDTGVAAPDPGVDEVCRGAAAALADRGAETADPVRIDAGAWQEPFYAMMGADRYASLGPGVYERPERRELLTDYARAHLEKAAAITGAAYSRALALRFRARRELDALFADTDLLLSPTVCVTAQPLAGPFRKEQLIAFTNFCNYTGLPAATVPCGEVAGLPVGLQVIGAPGADALVLRACRAFERLRPAGRPGGVAGPADLAADRPRAGGLGGS